MCHFSMETGDRNNPSVAPPDPRQLGQVMGGSSTGSSGSGPGGVTSERDNRPGLSVIRDNSLAGNSVDNLIA